MRKNGDKAQITKPHGFNRARDSLVNCVGFLWTEFATGGIWRLPATFWGLNNCLPYFGLYLFLMLDARGDVQSRLPVLTHPANKDSFLWRNNKHSNFTPSLEIRPKETNATSDLNLMNRRLDMQVDLSLRILPWKFRLFVHIIEFDGISRIYGLIISR